MTLLTAGTRGDTQPFVALGVGLKKLGHVITVAGSATFRSFVEQYGLDFFATNQDISDVASNAELWEVMQAGLYAACEGAELINYHRTNWCWSRIVMRSFLAQKTGRQVSIAMAIGFSMNLYLGSDVSIRTVYQRWPPTGICGFWQHDRLRTALQSCDSQDMRSNAQRIGRHIRRETGALSAALKVQSTFVK
jgi:hypothetical protein